MFFCGGYFWYGQFFGFFLDIQNTSIYVSYDNRQFLNIWIYMFLFFFWSRHTNSRVERRRKKKSKSKKKLQH